LYLFYKCVEVSFVQGVAGDHKTTSYITFDQIPSTFMLRRDTISYPDSTYCPA